MGHLEENGEKILYFDCNSGISGDMTLGALVDLGADVNEIKKELESMNIAPFNLVANKANKSGVWGIDLDVIIYDMPQHDHDFDAVDHSVHEHSALQEVYGSDSDLGLQISSGSSEHAHVDEHGHTSYAHIHDLIDGSGLKPGAKRIALSIFRAIAEAEAAVHNEPIEEIAFHEVGAMDSIIDIVGTAIAIDMLKIDKFVCGPIHDGQGQIVCRHGIIPVPVPAVIELLKMSNIPIMIETDVNTEMVTPTGAGILIGLNAEFHKRYAIVPEKVGYGFGKRDTGRFGAVRLIIGTEYEEYDEV
ncbi:MAG: LarC family nickel insertion protein [Clostridiales Family XIII bacterium]|nr:LarC family nickel insertion protein [Clostridiales Family XIII bacterium]